MNNVFVSSEDLSSFSLGLSAMSQEIEAVFGQIRNEMNYVSTIWNSPASAALQEQFAALSPSFDAYVNKLEQYAQYLMSTSMAYAENEQMLQGAARG